MNKDIEVILFDIGGVLVELKGFSKMLEWAQWTGPENEFKNKWFFSPPMDDYHKGKITTEDFVKKMIDEFKLPVDPSSFINEYEQYPKGLFEGAEELVKALAANYTVVSFSNNCEMHWDKLCRDDKIHELFHRHFLSHEIGMIKPDKEVYSYVINTLQCSPEKMVFFDDNQTNIDIAKEMGISALKVSDFNDLKVKIAELGLL